MEEKEIFIGIDTAIQPKWWQRVLSWFGVKKYRTDYSCMVIFKRLPNGDFIVTDNKFF